MKKVLLFATLLLPLFGAMEESVIPLLDSPPHIDEAKLNREQVLQMSCGYGIPLRVTSFNMLFDLYDHNLSPENRWPQRRARLVEYLRYLHPDLIGSQELEPHQTEYLMQELGDEYGSLGEEVVIYNKNRLCPLEVRTYGRLFTVVEFEDLRTEGCFTLINTHLAFGNVEKRLAEARSLKQLIEKSKPPVIVTGDFNTFPMRPDLNLPFYEGDMIMQIIEKGGVEDARTRAIKGYFGSLSSTNFSAETLQPFQSQGTPGVILDHIMVSPNIRVMRHAIDPAKVDGHYPSDHFPVIADVVIPRMRCGSANRKG